ncbi:MAG: hypothetical protein PHC84_04350 [Clostridia bacterium]|nr:hypothetical protein [Clostridia bacterium]
MTGFINNEDKQKFAVTGKIGLISTISPFGEPHITLISSIQAKDENTIMWGQFTHGLSKEYLRKNPLSGFFVLNMEKKWWRGKAVYTGDTDTGEDFDMYNNQPLFRYNTYFGIGKVHYMDVKDFSGQQDLNMGAIIKGALQGKFIKPFVKPCPDGIKKIKGLSLRLAKDMTSLKFLSYIDEEGFPIILPVIQAVMKDEGRIIIPLSVGGDEIKKLKSGAKLAMFYANLELSSVLLQGYFAGISKKLGVEYAVFDIHKVYNSMVPVVGYIYPMEPYRTVH